MSEEFIGRETNRSKPHMPPSLSDPIVPQVRGTNDDPSIRLAATFSAFGFKRRKARLNKDLRPSGRHASRSFRFPRSESLLTDFLKKCLIRPVHRPDPEGSVRSAPFGRCEQ